MLITSTSACQLVDQTENAISAEREVHGNGNGNGYGHNGVCDDVPQSAQGLCNAYCNAQSCYLQDPLSNSCQQILTNYQKHTDMPMPCGDLCYVPEAQRQTYTVEIMLTADDAWEGYFDGSPLGSAPNSSDWRRGDTISFTAESGCHNFAIHAWDVAHVISGYIAVVRIDGQVAYVTGDGSWLVTGTDPGTNWEELGFDTSSWVVPSQCSTTSPWGTYWPAPFYNEGAEWIWDTSNCRSLGEAWLRLDFQLP